MFASTGSTDRVASKRRQNNQKTNMLIKSRESSKESITPKQLPSRGVSGRRRLLATTKKLPSARKDVITEPEGKKAPSSPKLPKIENGSCLSGRLGENTHVYKP